MPSIRFKYVLFRGGDKFEIAEAAQKKGTSTIVGHANAAGAIAVGAVRFDRTPQYDGVLQVMSYSSRGGTPVNGVIRPDKPAFLAPSGVNTTVNLLTGNGDWQKDDNGDGIVDSDNPDPDIPNFFGTSASAPHAAAVAALVIQARKKFGVPAQAAGAGFIQANKAIGLFPIRSL
jgi:subtilisin family serine protease